MDTFGVVLGVYYDSKKSYTFDDPLSKAVLQLLASNGMNMNWNEHLDDFLPVLLSRCRPNCCLLDYFLVTYLIKQEICRYAQERTITNLSCCINADFGILERLIYDYLSLSVNAEAEAVTKRLYTILGVNGKEFGEVMEGVITSGLMLDLIKEEGM